MPDPVHRITEVNALEVLDSRGRTVLQISVTLADGTRGRAAVPSEANRQEMAGFRDSNPHRDTGPGIRAAVASIREKIGNCLVGPRWPDLSQIDAAMSELDATPDSRRLGANAIAAASMACARALARSAGMELWQWLTPRGVQPRLPVPHFSAVNGGVHAPTDLDFQEFMIVPLGARSLPAAIRAGAEVYTVLRSLLAGKGHPIRFGGNGGFTPQIPEPEDVLELLMTAIAVAGYEPGASGIAIALHPAASMFRRPDGRYELASQVLSTAEMIEWYAEIIDRFPVWLVEDGLASNDWEGWAKLTSRIGHRIQLVGNDIFMTNPAIITNAIGMGIGNAAAIKLNQAGTVTRTLQAMAACRSGHYAQLIAHGPEETSGTFAADLAVSSGNGELKAWVPPHGERAADCDRLLEIAEGQPRMACGPRPG
jgi:enolase 1/2/3